MGKGIWTYNTRTTFGTTRDMEMAAWREVDGAWLLAHNDPELITAARAERAETIFRADPDKALPDFASDAAMQAHAEAFVEARNVNGTTAIHLTNEIGSTPALQKWTRYCMEYAVRNSLIVVPFSYGTHAPQAVWAASEDNVRYAIEHGFPVGVHLYLDGKHDETAWYWLPLKDEYGGTWAFTEINYIHDYRDGDHGPRGDQDDEEHATWLTTTTEHFIEKVGVEGIILCYFSFDQWPDNEEGIASGFGSIDRPKSRAALAALNARYIYVKGLPKMATPSFPDTAPPLVNATAQPHVLTTVPSTYVNIRAQPRADQSSDYGDLLPGDEVDLYAEVNGWRFLVPTKQVVRPADRQPAAAGWVSLQEGRVVFTPIPAPPPGGGGLSDAELETLTSAVVVLNGAADDIRTQTANIQRIAEQQGGTLPDGGGF